MATAKKNTYITMDLDWAESQLATWRVYIDDNPINLLEDRWGKKEMPKGGATWVIVADIEKQIKSIRDTMKEYLQLLEIVNRLREVEEERKIKTRGDTEVNGMMAGMMKTKT